MEASEEHISAVNANFFFKEFSFSKNKFQPPSAKEELELADNFVWLDDFLFIFQIKGRNEKATGSVEKWYKKKVRDVAVGQIKNSLEYLKSFKQIKVQNEKRHEFDVSEARNVSPTKVIIYSADLPDSIRFQKFHESSSAGLIHLLHLEDYSWICKYLVTPSEIHEYLKFRESFYQAQKISLNSLPEQYVLGHYFETLETDHFNASYINNFARLQDDFESFDISFVIDQFQDKIIKNPENRDYYQIIKEIAKLHRAELREFKKRWTLSLEKSKNQEFTIPYRIVSLNTKCGFVFIPFLFENKDKWHNALLNYTEAHKYDQKLDKCIGMIVYHNPDQKFWDMNWCLVNAPWEHDTEFEEVLRNNFPFREVRPGTVYKYFMKND